MRILIGLLALGLMAEPARVLVIGDSISVGYTPAVTALLAGKAAVTHNEGNAAHTNNGLEKLEGWIGAEKWKVITFNFGLHDLKIMDGGEHQVGLAAYEQNLDAIAGRLQKTGARLIYVMTTPVPQGKLSPPRKPGDEVLYNQAALRVMERRRIRVVDLHAVAKGRLAEWQTPANVHFTKAGSAELGAVVAKAIAEELER